MKIAVGYDNGNIFQHFGRTEEFKVYEFDGEKIVHEEVVDTMGAGHGALVTFLKNLGVEALICGGIGPGAQEMLADSGIRLYAGVTGSADGAVMALIDRSLEYVEEANCDHHGEHHGESHGCGHHGGGCGHGGCHTN